MRVRPEWFGAAVALERPRAVVQVNRAMARLLGVADSSRWRGPDPGRLSAPTEVHVVVSKRCSAGCRSCYVDARPDGLALSFEQAKAILSGLADLGVFHVALGGGEALDLDYLFDLASFARHIGLLPNLTTNGLDLTARAAERCRVFGQINVSIDGVGEGYRQARGQDGFERARHGLRLLRRVKREVGLNCVLTRSNFDRLGEIVAFAKAERLSEVELLRFKPAGRGLNSWKDESLTVAQARELYPKVRWLALRHRLRVKLDCSFAPMVFWHRPSLAACRFFGVVGCSGGDLLAAVHPDGALTGCSFGGPVEASAFEPASVRKALDGGFGWFRDFKRSAPEPCRSCLYLDLCNGGCRVVAQASGGDAFAPDPGCPTVAGRRLPP
ncbi:MAG TPA: radical SAM protein [Myxococcales bacterium]